MHKSKAFAYGSICVTIEWSVRIDGTLFVDKVVDCPSIIQDNKSPGTDLEGENFPIVVTPFFEPNDVKFSGPRR